MEQTFECLLRTDCLPMGPLCLKQGEQAGPKAASWKLKLRVRPVRM